MYVCVCVISHVPCVGVIGHEPGLLSMRTWPAGAKCPRQTLSLFHLLRCDGEKIGMVPNASHLNKDDSMLVILHTIHPLSPNYIIPYACTSIMYCVHCLFALGLTLFSSLVVDYYFIRSCLIVRIKRIHLHCAITYISTVYSNDISKLLTRNGPELEYISTRHRPIPVLTI